MCFNNEKNTGNLLAGLLLAAVFFLMMTCTNRIITVLYCAKDGSAKVCEEYK